MPSAPIDQQRLLIDLQQLDSTLAALRHERSHLPVLARIEATIERLKANRRAAVSVAGVMADAQSASTRRENEVEQVVRRAAALRQRMSSGEAATRDLSAIQGEIDQLGRRQAALEEAQIEAMEALEAARADSERIVAQEQEIRAAGRELTATRDAEFARIDHQIEQTQAARDDLAGTIDAALLAEYEAVRSRTGGLGAVALRGNRLEGTTIEISPAELARFTAAPAYEVLHAEENDVIIVRMDI